MMTRRGFASWVLLGAAVLGLNACGENQPGGRAVEELRYRLAVEVDTPDGIKSGSGVIEVRAVKNPDWLTPEARRYRYSFKGEAVAVDLAGGRTLFALLKSDSGAGDASEYPWFAFADRLKDTRDPLQHMQRMRGWMGETVEMTSRREVGKAEQAKSMPKLPMLVTFKDITDPTSVERVNPDDLAASFGKGYRLKAITMQVTDEAVTTGIEKRLGWLGDKNRKRFDPQHPPEGIPLGNYRGLFSTEISK